MHSYISVFLVLPLPPSFPCVLGFWRSFWDLPDPPGTLLGTPRAPKRLRDRPWDPLWRSFGPPLGAEVDLGSIWVDFESILGRFNSNWGRFLTGPPAGLLGPSAALNLSCWERKDATAGSPQPRYNKVATAGLQRQGCHSRVATAELLQQSCPSWFCCRLVGNPG